MTQPRGRSVRRASIGILALLGALVLAVSPAAAGQRNCTANQLKDVSKYTNKLYKCLSKQDATCADNAGSKFTKKLEKTQKRSSCKIETDFEALNLGLTTLINTTASDLEQSLSASGQADCTKSQLKEAGKYTSKLYRCLSKATKNQTGAADCIDNAESKFVKKLEKTTKDLSCRVGDFDTFRTALTAAVDVAANDLQQSLKNPYALIEPCQAGFSDFYEVKLFNKDFVEVRVDTVDDAFYFDPAPLTVVGVTNIDCVLRQAGPTQPQPPVQSEFPCSYGPAGSMCPAVEFESRATLQVCGFAVEVEGSCENPAFGDYRLEVLVNGNAAPADRVRSNVAP
jgi:hypothetical protein